MGIMIIKYSLNYTREEQEVNYMYKALDIAKYVVNKCTVEEHPVSNLQLQKILYYIQKTFLDSDMIAFEDEIEAWQFGPVVPDVYYKYCGFGSMSIRMKYNVNIERKYANIIDPIVKVKRILDPWDLVEDTHKPGKAWAQIYKGGLGNHHVIPKSLIKEIG